MSPLLCMVPDYFLFYSPELLDQSALESILLGGAKKILGCSSKTYYEAVCGLETLKSRRDRAKLK